MQAETVRLEILKLLIPTASRVGITEPEKMIEISRTFEKYVLECDQTGADMPDAPGRRQPGRPRKDKSDPSTPEFLTPPSGGQVDSSSR